MSIPKYEVTVKLKDGSSAVIKNGLCPRTAETIGRVLVVRDVDKEMDYLIPWDEFKLVIIKRVNDA